MVEHIRFDGDALELLDQRVLPREVRWIRCVSADDVARAIADMVVRGAPAIGITAAYGLALAARRGDDLLQTAATLRAARPTAANLGWALDRLLAGSVDPGALTEAARALHEDDIRINQALGDHGAVLLPEDAVVMTHCNAGTLATGGWGTALGVARSARARGRLREVYACETRPWLQGARLTAWELQQDGIPCTLITDNAAAAVLASGRVAAILVGADRVAANGDTANKIGTLGLAVLARHFDVPFYVCVPRSTLDPTCPDGGAIPIEHRPDGEVRGHAGAWWAAEVPVYNPAFDVTPARLISAWITEDGPWQPGSPSSTPVLSG